MTRLAIVGCEASGKTVFMSALADLYRDALTPENPAANRFARLAARQLRARREWPPATNPERSAALDFALRTNGRRLARFSLLEFGGETFRAAFRDDEGAPAHKSAVKRLLDYLADADFVTVLVSLKELLRNPGAVPMEDFERDTESLWVTRGLLEFVRAHLPRAGVVIGLTRADLYRAEIAAADGRPAEGFSTEGALTIMHEYLRQNSETPEQLLAELAGERTELETLKPAGSPTFYANKLRRFVAKLDRAEAAVVMSGRAPGEEIAALRRAADAFTQALRQTGPKPKPRKNKAPQEEEKGRGGRAPAHASGAASARGGRRRARRPLPARDPGRRRPAPAPASRRDPPARGAAIEARWTDTSADGKAITLETRGGKKIRAVLRKFSDEDRAFVESELRR